MLPRNDLRWTRRETLAALACLPASGATARSQDGTKFIFADQARSLATTSPGALTLLIPLGSRKNIEPIARDFKQLTGVAIHIREAEVREIGTTLLVNKLQGKKRFDIALPATYEIPDLVAADALIPLDDLEGFQSAQAHYPSALYTNGDSFDGKAYGHQTDGDVYLMICNEGILSNPEVAERYADQHGAALVPPKSWQEFDRQIRFVHERLEQPGAIMFRGNGGVEWEFWLRLHAKGIWPLNANFDPQIDSEQGIEVLEDMIETDEFVVDASGDRNFGAVWQDFQSSGAYATFGWGGTQKIFREASKGRADRYRFAPIPGGEEPGTPEALSYFNWGWSYTVVSGTDVPELALSFVNFAITPEMSSLAVRESGGFFDPFRPEHYEDPDIRDIYGPAFLAVHKNALMNAIPDFYIADRGAYFESLGAWLELALQRGIKPETALKNAADHWRLLGDEAERGNQAKRWQQLRSKYPHQVSSRLRDLPV